MAEINYIDYGLAHVIDDRIYINRKLKKYPDLLNKVLKHELRHISAENSLVHDWNTPFDMGLFMFCLKNPDTWIHFLPVWIKDRKIIIDKNQLIFQSVSLGLVILFAGLAIWIYST